MFAIETKGDNAQAHASEKKLKAGVLCAKRGAVGGKEGVWGLGVVWEVVFKQQT